MAVTEVKKEPIEYPTDYEESVLNNINKPPLSKVSILFCIKMYHQISNIVHSLNDTYQRKLHITEQKQRSLLFCLLRLTSTCAWYVAVGLLRTACCCVTAVMTAITSSV